MELEKIVIFTISSLTTYCLCNSLYITLNNNEYTSPEYQYREDLYLLWIDAFETLDFVCPDGYYTKYVVLNAEVYNFLYEFSWKSTDSDKIFGNCSDDVIVQINNFMDLMMNRPSNTSIFKSNFGDKAATQFFHSLHNYFITLHHYK